MSAEEFILIPKEVFIRTRPVTDHILSSPGIKAKGKQLSLLQRQPHENELDEDDTEIDNTSADKTVREIVLKQLIPLLNNDSQRRRAEFIYDLIENNKRVGVDNSGVLLIDGVQAGVSTSTFIYNLLQTSKKIDTTLYRTLLTILSIPEHSVINTYAKAIINDNEAPRAKRVKEADVSTPGRKAQWTPTKKDSPWKNF